MTKSFSIKKKGSKQPRKQRRSLYNLPIHKKGELLNVHLSPDLRNKYSLRNLRVRKGDKVKIISGQHKGKTGRVEIVSSKETKVTVNGIETIKKDGSKSFYKFHPSNLMITELDLSDKKRMKRVKLKTSISKDVPKDKIKTLDQKNEVPVQKEKKITLEENKVEQIKKTETSNKNISDKNTKEDKK